MTPRTAAPILAAARVATRAVARAAAFVLVMPALALSQTGPGGPGAAGGTRGPTEVGVMTAARSTVPVTVTLPGRAVAFQQAAITPKVGGEVREVAYEPGSTVKAGTVLFRLEDETIAAQLNAEQHSGTNGRLKISQEEIASLCGVSRQRCNAALTRLAREGVLQTHYGGMTILDREGLYRHAKLNREPADHPADMPA